MKTEIQRKKEREGEGRRRSCHEGERGGKGEIWFTTLPMFTNANGKRKCRKMRRPAVIPVMRRKMAFSAPRFLRPGRILFLLLFCSPASGMRLSATCSVAVSPILFPSLALPLLYPFPFFPPIFVFVLLPSVCVLPSSRLFLFSLFFFQGRERSAIPSAAGKNEEGKVRFAFLFLFVCSPEEGKGKRTAFSFFFSKRRKEMRSFFLFHDERKGEKNILRSFSSSASDKKHSFRSFFFFLKKESVLSSVSVRGWEGRFIAAFFFFSFFFCLYEKGKRFLHMDAGVLFFFFRFQEKKRRER